MSDPKPTRIGMTIGSTSRNGDEFEFKKISLSLDRDLAPLENPLDAFRSIKALLERMASEFQGYNPAPLTGAVSPRPVVSKLETLQERLGPRLQDLEVTDGIDGLIVKPRRYLGSAWAQVNEAIRSLGGRWESNGKQGSWRIPK